MVNHLSFGFFYTLCLLAGATFFIHYGFKRKYPKADWLTIIAVIITCIIFGLKLLGVPPSEWKDMINPSSVAPIPKFLPGAGLGLLSGWIIVRLLYKFRTPMIDSFIMIIPGIIVVQRIGCFINGCCYGKACDLPWAVSFSAGSEAVHPTQLYSIAGALLVLFILILTRERWKMQGSRALFGMILLLSMRFVIEFFRYTSPEKWYAETYLLLSVLQWVLITTILFLGIILFLREFNGNTIRIEIIPERKPVLTLIVISILQIVLWNTRTIFEIQELAMIQLILLLAAGLLLYEHLSFAGTIRSKLAFAFGFIIVAGSTGWQVVDSGINNINPDTKSSWFNLSVSGGYGGYEHRERDCDGSIIEKDARELLGAGIDFSISTENQPGRRFDYGIKSSISQISGINTGRSRTYNNYNINPYFSYNMELLGTSIGANFLTLPEDDRFHLIPSVYLRFGNEDVFFVDAGIFDQLDYSSYLSYGHAGVGFGFNTEGRSRLKLGLSIAGYPNYYFQDILNFYLHGEFQIAHNFYITPGLYLGNKAYGVFGFSADIGK